MKVVECYICSNNDARFNYGDDDRHIVSCPRCGKYAITGLAIHMWQRAIHENSQFKRLIPNASSWILRNQNTLIEPNIISSIFLKLNAPNFHERSNVLLMELEKRTEFAGHYCGVDLDWPRWLSLCHCINRNEFKELLKYLSEEARIKEERPETEYVQGSGSYKITPKGWAHLEDFKRFQPDSMQGFIAMSFNPLLEDVYMDGLFAGIDDAGYKPYRVDRDEHVEKIDDRIIAQIRRSRFVVADFTGHKGGVYFEAGFALGLGLPVFWTCKKEELESLHFDIRQYNCIDWKDVTDLRERLKNRIEAIIGRGKA